MDVVEPELPCKMIGSGSSVRPPLSEEEGVVDDELEMTGDPDPTAGK